MKINMDKHGTEKLSQWLIRVYLIVLIHTLILSGNSFVDQCAVISKEQALSALNYLMRPEG